MIPFVPGVETSCLFHLTRADITTARDLWQTERDELTDIRHLDDVDVDNILEFLSTPPELTLRDLFKTGRLDKDEFEVDHPPNGDTQETPDEDTRETTADSLENLFDQD